MADESDFYAEAERRQARLLEQLAVSPIQEVVGVVGASGAAGSKAREAELWTLIITLDAWRLAGGDVQVRPLMLRREVTYEELGRFSDLIAPYATIWIRARVVDDPHTSGSQGLLEALLDPNAFDRELQDHANRLQQPVTLDDPILGTFTLDRRIDWFTAESVWDGSPVSLNLAATDPPDVQEALKTAHALWQAQREWDQRVRDHAVTSLLPLKNDSWLDEEEAAVTADQFKSRMSLESITVYPDGSFEFWHGDGSLFAGHSIQICGSLSEGLTDADIPG